MSSSGNRIARLFITLEGGEGSGKSSQAEALKALLEARATVSPSPASPPAASWDAACRPS